MTRNITLIIQLHYLNLSMDLETRFSNVKYSAIVVKHRNQISINGLVGRKMKRKKQFS